MAGVAPRLVLASASPRRRDLLAQAGVSCRVQPADVDETPLPGESAAAMVERLSIAKAETVAQDSDDQFVVAGDTTVLIDRQILGKPADRDDAARMLGLLSGSRHYVVSGLAVVEPGGLTASGIDVSAIWMADLDDADIDWYLSTGEYNGKAGAYAIQGLASVFVQRIEGDYHSVVGLPLALLDQLLGRLGRRLRDFS